MNTDKSMNFDLNELNNISDEQSELIQNILWETKPEECNILGKKTIRQISKGRKFDSVEGGRHMSFVETISVLSGIATMIQLAIFVIGNLRQKSEVEEEDEQTKQEAKDKVKSLMSSHPESKKLEKIAESDSAILDKIINESIRSRKTKNAV
jgi:hypothetical protein